jgi:sulfatase maturation enzyme AslB (radical SAM superfamily)
MPAADALARALAESERLAAAQRLEEAETLLAQFAADPECLFRRGALLLTMKRWAEAEACLRAVLAVAPGHFDTAMGLAGALVEQGKAAEALPWLDAAIRAKPDSGRVRYFRGVALDELGRTDEGRAELDAARAMLIAPLERRGNRPWEVYVQLSRRCNLRCAMCGHEVWQSNSGFMEKDVYDRVLSECAANGIRRLTVLSGQGEPLLHPRIFEMLEQAVAAGFETHIVTNGTPLNPQRCQRLAKMGLAGIQFSFAGWDAASYESVYAGAKFDKTLANLEAMQTAVRGTRTDFFVKAVVSGDDWEAVSRRTREFLQSRGIDKVFTMAANNFGGTVQVGRLDQRHGVWSLKSLAHQRRMPCRLFLTAVGVFCDGTVTACGCYDSNAELKIGHIMEQSLADIRQGEAFRRILQAFRSDDLAGVPMCGKCDDPFG